VLKNWILDQNFDFWRKFELFNKVLIFDENFDFWQKNTSNYFELSFSQPMRRATRAPRNPGGKKADKASRRQVTWSSSDESDENGKNDSDTEEVLPSRSTTKRGRKVN